MVNAGNRFVLWSSDYLIKTVEQTHLPKRREKEEERKGGKGT